MERDIFERSSWFRTIKIWVPGSNNIRFTCNVQTGLRMNYELKILKRDLFRISSGFRTKKIGVLHSNNIWVTCNIPTGLRMNNELKRLKRNLFGISSGFRTFNTGVLGSNNIRPSFEWTRREYQTTKLKWYLLGICMGFIITNIDIIEAVCVKSYS